MRTWTGLTVAAGLLLVAGCGADGLETGAGTVEKKTTEAFLATAEGDWHRRVDAEPHKNLSTDARCYLVTGADSNKSLGTMACGPLRRLGTAEGRVWDIVRVQATGSDKPGLEIPTNEPWQRSQVHPESSALWRPDDKKAPDNADTLAAPPPPAETAGFTDITDKPATLELRPADGKLVVPDGTLTLQGIATPATIGSGTEIRRPADGEKFVAAVFGTTPTLDGLTGEPAVQAATTAPARTKWTLTVGSEQRPVTVLTKALTATTSGQMIIASVPENASDVLLTATNGALTQSLSLVSGKRTTTAAAAYYRTTTTATLAKTLTNGSVNQGRDFESKLDLTLKKAALTPWDPQRGWAPAGKAWVRVSLESELEFTWILYTNAWTKPFVTATVDGVAVAPSDATPESGTATLLVPETAKSVVLMVTPRMTFASKTFSEPSPRSGTAVYPTLTATATFQ